MTSKREHDKARRRQERYQDRQSEREAEKRRRTLRAAVIGGVSVAAIIGTLVVASVLGGRDTPVAEPSVAASLDAANPCPPGLDVPAEQPSSPAQVPAPDDGAYTAVITTTCGDVTVSLDGPAAPQAVGSFVGLVESGWFDSSPCHRLTTTGIFVLQCGDPTATGSGGPDYRFGPIENAPADDLYPAGTLAMARVGGDDSSMGSQFFLVYEDSTIPSDDAGGYTVFGTVTSGLDTLQQIAEGGLGPDGIAPARTIGIVNIDVEAAT